MGSCHSSKEEGMHRNIDPKALYRPEEPDIIEQWLVQNQNNHVLDRQLGCAYGQALGDAYGLSTEFENRHSVAQLYPDPRALIPFPNYIQTNHSRRWTRGDWTDDTDQWIAILDTLVDGSGDERRFARRLKYWIEHGYPELGDHGGMGIGAHVHEVVYTSGYTSRPIEISQQVWERGGRKSAPNGAVMRCSACAFVHWKDENALRNSTIKMCQTTHVDPRCVASCLAICLLVGKLIERQVDDATVEKLARHVQSETLRIVGEHMPEEHRDEFLWYTDAARTLEDLKLDESSSIGYTYKCLASGFYGLRSKSDFATTLYKLIQFGGDADTNGAVCGTVYGARHGYRSLPNDWLKAMPFKKWFDQKIMRTFR